MSTNNATLCNAECVGFSEIDKHAEAVYRYHYDHRNYGDATAIVPEQLPDFDFLLAGFPCQAFSIAGKRQGFDDARGTLFFEIARILSHKRPAHFLLENVGGLRSHDGGKTMQRILGVLSDLGYFVEVPLLNSKDYGVPQNRERVFFIGHSGEQCQREILSVGNSSGTADELPRHQAHCLTARYHGAGATGTYIAERALDAPRLAALTETRTEEAKRIRRESRKQGQDFSPRRGKELVPRTDDLMNCVTATQTIEQAVTDFSRIRRLTPIECERLQGLPDDYTEFGRYGDEIREVSDTQRYKGLGNAFTVNVIEAIVTKMLEAGCLK